MAQLDMAARDKSLWIRLDTALARLRPHREPLSLLIDAGVVALCWNATYLFRLGFERWLSARPSYDGWVLAGVVLVYMLASLMFKVPQGMWRFSGFGEIKRLTLACFAAGLLAAVAVLMAQLVEVPRAVLALHPVIALMGLCTVRIAYRMLYEHMRGRIAGDAIEKRRALVLGAGDAARLLVAGIQHEGWVVVGLLDDDPVKHRSRVGGVPILGPLASVKSHIELQGITHLVLAMPGASATQRRGV